MSKLSERRREIHGMDQLTAEQELKTLRRQLFDLRIQKERGEVKDTRQFAKTKDDVARLLHHLSELRHADLMEAEGLHTGSGKEPAPAARATTHDATAPAARARRATTPAATETPVMGTSVMETAMAPTGLSSASTNTTSASTTSASTANASMTGERVTSASSAAPATTTGSEDQEG